jgi:hypothetical protein
MISFYRTDGWLDTNSKYDTLSGDVKSSAEITLAFSFLSIPAWVSNTVRLCSSLALLSVWFHTLLRCIHSYLHAISIRSATAVLLQIAISIISYKSYVRVERVQFCTESKDTSKPM